MLVGIFETMDRFLERHTTAVNRITGAAVILALLLMLFGLSRLSPEEIRSILP